MKAENISSNKLNPVAGVVEPGKEGEFTPAEYDFLRRKGKVGVVIEAKKYKKVGGKSGTSNTK